MRKKIKIWIYPFILIEVLLMLSSSCKKDDDNNNEGTVTDIDGNVYHTVTIGTQVWMVENLKTTKYHNGDPIPNVTDGIQWSNLTTGTYCNYDNDINNAYLYGRLYNWYAVNDSRNIAPMGWHVPTDNEWTALTDLLGGIGIAGGKMKETVTTHWTAPNTGADNSSGFTALPGGYRYPNGTYHNIGSYGLWWSFTEYDASNAWGRLLSYNNAVLDIANVTMKNGCSVRCLKD